MNTTWKSAIAGINWDTGAWEQPEWRTFLDRTTACEYIQGRFKKLLQICVNTFGGDACGVEWAYDEIVLTVKREGKPVIRHTFDVTQEDA